MSGSYQGGDVILQKRKRLSPAGGSKESLTEDDSKQVCSKRKHRQTMTQQVKQETAKLYYSPLTGNLGHSALMKTVLD